MLVFKVVIKGEGERSTVVFLLSLSLVGLCLYFVLYLSFI